MTNPPAVSNCCCLLSFDIAPVGFHPANLHRARDTGLPRGRTAPKPGRKHAGKTSVCVPLPG